MDDRGRPVTRRGFLAGAAAFAALPLLQACSSQPAAPAKPADSKPAESKPAVPVAGTSAPAKPAESKPAATTAPAANGATISLRFGTIWPTNRFDHTVAETFANNVRERTNGEVEIVIHPASQLGNERELTESVKLGAVDMTSGGGAIQGFVPEVGIFYLPYLYKDYDQFERVWTLGKHPVADKIAQMVEDKAGIKVLGYFLGGTRDTILRNKPIRELADYRGVKIRVDDAPTSTATFQALGASPTPVPYNEVYQALQTGVGEAAENPPNGLLGQKWYEVAKYVSLTDHLMVLHLEQINLNSWKKLNGEQQKGVQAAMDEAVQEYNRLARTGRDNDIAELQKQGMEVNEIPDKSAFSKAVQGMHEEFVNKYGLQAEYDAILKA